MDTTCLLLFINYYQVNDESSIGYLNFYHLFFLVLSCQFFLLISEIILSLLDALTAPTKARVGIVRRCTTKAFLGALMASS